jgi:integrase
MPKNPDIGVGTFYQRGKRGTWYFQHKASGVTASLGTTDANVAEQEALTRYAYLRLDQRSEQLEQAVASLDTTKRRSAETRRERVELCPEDIWAVYEEQLALVSRARLHDSATAEKPLSANYLRQQRSSLAKVLGAYQGEAKWAHEVTEAEAQRTFAKLVRGGAAPSSINRYLADMRTIWGRISARILAPNNPWRAVEKRTKGELARTRKSKRPFTKEELETIHEKATGWIRVAAMYGHETGLRLGDVLTLRWDEIDGEYLLREDRKTGKVDAHYCPRANELATEWVGQHGKSDWVFPDQAARYLGLDGFRPNGAAGAKAFAKFLREACGFETRDGGRTILGFHSFRSEVATQLDAHGGDAREALHHSDSQTTAGYVQHDLQTLRDKARARYLGTGEMDAIKARIERLSAAEREELRCWLADMETPQQKG